ncbi:MAG: GTP-binding protein, partial [Sulfuritalea sp.]|nr:GTP-binding protein [Sulfuritalea sp.]
MANYTTESIRAVALVGHGGAGKTTLVEALLFKAGAIAAKGAVEKGNSVCDFDAQEKSAGHSLNSALVNFAVEGVHVHLID